MWLRLALGYTLWLGRTLPILPRPLNPSTCSHRGRRVAEEAHQPWARRTGLKHDAVTIILKDVIIGGNWIRVYGTPL